MSPHHKSLQVELTTAQRPLFLPYLAFALFPSLEEGRVAVEACMLFPSTACELLGSPTPWYTACLRQALPVGPKEGIKCEVGRKLFDVCHASINAIAIWVKER